MEIVTLYTGGVQHPLGDGHLVEEQRDIVSLHRDDEEDGEEEQEERDRPDSSLLPHPTAPMGNYDVLDEPAGPAKSAITGETSCSAYMYVYGEGHVV